jgi:hypothetical protein
MARVRSSVVSAAVVLAVAVVCLGSYRVFGGETSSTASAGSTRPNDIPGMEALQSNFDRFNGSREERAAGALLAAHALNDSMDECMSRAGFPEWDPTAAKNAAPRVDALAGSQFFSAPLSRRFSNTVMDIRARYQAEELLTGAKVSEGEMSASSTCLKEEPQPSDAAVDAVTRPRTSRGLLQEWWTVLAEFDGEFGDLKTYNSCMSSHSLSVLHGGDADQLSIVQGLESLVPPSDLIPANEDDPLAQGEEWRRLLSAEADVESADWACRGATYNDHIDEVVQRLEEFIAQHEDDIRATHQGWMEIVAKAQAQPQGQ